MIAGLGFMVLVVIKVAIELGPSVQPLIKITPKLMIKAIYAQGWLLQRAKNCSMLIEKL